MGKRRSTAPPTARRNLTNLERDNELLGLRNSALATSFGSYAGQSSQIYGDSTTGASSADSWPFHAIGGPNDVLVPKGEACQRISELLSDVTHQAGEYSFGGEAKPLPVLPGLALKNDPGFISLPLQKENSEKLLKCCSKERENVWALPGDRVEMRNPEWSAGIDSLSDLCAARMGYKGVAMHVVLSKLVIIGEGGCLQEQQDQDENDRCIAKLVVRLPSQCAGGDLVVHEEGTKNISRYTLGGQKGVAAFKPHYAMYTAGAFRAFEEVVTGFSFLLVYSLCLPPNLPFVRGSNGSDLLRMGLAEAMAELSASQGESAVKGENVDFQNLGAGSIEGDTSIVALVLSKSFHLQDLTTAGADAQTSMDMDRLAYLSASNAILPPEKQLRFYIAIFQYKILDVYSRWDQKKAEESATWYSIRGEQLSGDTPAPVNWTHDFNFLNPGKETLGQLWKKCDGEFVYTYERYALVGWPSAVDIQKAHTFMGETAAANSVFMDSPVDYVRLRMLLKYEAGQHNQDVTGIPPQMAAIAALNNVNAAAYGQQYGQGSQAVCQNVPIVSKTPVTLLCCQNLCKAISESDDVVLVDIFFRKYFIRLGQKRELAPLIADIVRKFEWEVVSAPFVRALDGLPYSLGMGLLLQLAEALLDMASARAALIIIAVQKAGFAFAICPEDLVISSDVGLLWKHAMACQSLQIFRDVGNMFAGLDTKIIGPVVEALAKCVTLSGSPEHRQMLLLLASKRRQWLTVQIAEAEKPFVWEIVDMNFVGAAGMASFLQGTNTSYQVRCFKGIDDAHKRMAMLRQKIIAPLKMTVGGRGRDAYVLVVKQAGKFTQRNQDIQRFKAEIFHLNHLLAVDHNTANGATRTTSTSTSRPSTTISASHANTTASTSSGVKVTSPAMANTGRTKRPREEPEVIVIE